MRGYIFKVYGARGHRQAASFGESTFHQNIGGVAIEFRCADVTGTNEYVEVAVYCENFVSCVRRCLAQISDGIFENCRTGKVTVKSFNYIEVKPSKGVTVFKG